MSLRPPTKTMAPSLTNSATSRATTQTGAPQLSEHAPRRSRAELKTTSGRYARRTDRSTRATTTAERDDERGAPRRTLGAPRFARRLRLQTGRAQGRQAPLRLLRLCALAFADVSRV